MSLLFTILTLLLVGGTLCAKTGTCANLLIHIKLTPSAAWNCNIYIYMHIDILQTNSFNTKQQNSCLCFKDQQMYNQES